MNTIANESAYWVSNSAPLDFSTGPEKFGIGPVAPQIAKPTDFFSLFQGEATPRSRDMNSRDDWIDINSLPVLPPKARFPVALQIVNVGRGPLIPLDIDDVDLELFDLNSVQALAPIASYDATLEVEGKVTRGGFDPSGDEILLPRQEPTPVNVIVVSREKPPFEFHDEADGEDEILLPPPHRTAVNVKIGFSGRPAFLFQDEFEDEAL